MERSFVDSLRRRLASVWSLLRVPQLTVIVASATSENVHARFLLHVGGLHIRIVPSWQEGGHDVPVFRTATRLHVAVLETSTAASAELFCCDERTVCAIIVGQAHHSRKGILNGARNLKDGLMKFAAASLPIHGGLWTHCTPRFTHEPAFPGHLIFA